MSIVAYAQMTNFREAAKPGESLPNAKTGGGISTYTDALAALVPAEVLTVHALIISAVTTKTDQGAKITDMSSLSWAFYGMCALSVFIYIVPRAMGGQWDRVDILRMLVPLFAFIGWTMLQPTSAFDAVAPSVTIAQRTIVAIFFAVILGALATVFAYKADAKKVASPEEPVSKELNHPDAAH